MSCVTWTSAGAGGAQIGARPPNRPSATLAIRQPTKNGWPFDLGALMRDRLKEVGQFSDATSGASGQGDRTLTVVIADHPKSAAADAWLNFDAWFLFLLPASMTSGFDVSFTVESPGKPPQRYAYPILERGGLWLPLLPFAWISLLTPNADDAFRATVQRFIADSSASGA
jgi:hypothetical protein